MRQATWHLVWLLAAGMATSVGCSTPTTVHVSHCGASALPLSAGAKTARLGQFTMRGDGDVQPMAAELRQQVQERLSDCGTVLVAEDQPADLTLLADGLATVRRIDGAKPMRRYDVAKRDLVALDVQSSVLEVDVRITWTVADGWQKRLWAVDTHEEYSSAQDPSLRGPLAIGRPGDPAMLPSQQQVVADLVNQCAQTFCQMLEPVRTDASLTLRPTSDSHNRRGIAAMRQRDTRTAISNFQLAVNASKPSQKCDHLFNLAVAQESEGSLDAAMGSYQQALEANPDDLVARESVTRLTAVGRPNLE